MKHTFSLFACLLLSLSAFSAGVEIDGIHYILDNGSYTASVTYTGESYLDNTYSGYITIPDSVYFDGAWYNVTSIDTGAFMYCHQLSYVHISENVTSIGGSAFANCATLGGIYIPDGVTSIDSYTFADCYGFTGFDVPKNITDIGDFAFMNCSRLLSVSLPDSLTYLGNSAFMGCTNLSNVNIPKGLYGIESNTFDGCALTSIIFPESISFINPRAFSGCRFSSLVFPKSLSYIESEAFSNCITLEHISCMGMTPPFCGNNAFENVPRNIPLYVSSSAVDAYNSADQWGEFDVQPFLVNVNPVSMDTTQLTWAPVDSASLYKLHIYTDSTSLIVVDTTLSIVADSLNGGVLLPLLNSVPSRINRVILDDIGSVVIITINPTSGLSESNPFIVTVSTSSNIEIPFHFDIKVYCGDHVIKQDYGDFVLNDFSLYPTCISDVEYIPQLPSGIYDIFGKYFPLKSWESLPPDIYIIRENGKSIKRIKL